MRLMWEGGGGWVEKMEGGEFNGRGEVKAWRRGENRLSSKRNPFGSLWPLFSMHSHYRDDSGGRRRPLFLSDLPLH